MTRKEAEAFIQRIVEIRDGADDALASTVVELYPTLKGNNALITVGTRIHWNGSIKRAAVDLWDTADNNPDNAPALWEDINYREGYRVIPEVLTVGTAFMANECGWWGDKLHQSVIDNNVWTPDAYPAGWLIME